MSGKGILTRTMKAGTSAIPLLPLLSLLIKDNISYFDCDDLNASNHFLRFAIFSSSNFICWSFPGAHLDENYPGF